MDFIDLTSLHSYSYLLVLAAILLTTKLLGLFSRWVRLPQVLGALVAGVILGPVVNAIVGWSTVDGFFSQAAGSDQLFGMLSELGVIVLMFGAGLETDVQEMKKCGKASLIIAVIGVVTPLIFGAGASYFFIDDPNSQERLLKSIFIGVVLTATSVSITVETLKELGKLNTPASNAILGAAIIDDVLGIIALTIITSFKSKDVNIWFVLIKIVLFFIFAAVLGFIMLKIYKWMNKHTSRDSRRHVIIAFAYCLVSSFVAEVFFGVADITGAYVAGLVLSMTNRKRYLVNRFSTLSYMLLSPIFFACIGLTIEMPELTVSLLIFAILITIVAVATKLFGCALGGKICGYSTRECFQIGAGMISRGEVALIVAKKGESCGLMDPKLFGPLVIVVVLTTIIAPIILKILFAKDKDNAPTLKDTKTA
ncbi:MAG: cation:proton antiporter [Ruminococcus sp.]|nr:MULTISPECIES: cation:proton antiporter [Ruminococcus]MCI5598544.1 cation:proton antiporter [Ruminococcus sp.]MCI6505693.1 cation:proton antiporter [Ruminococcus sp.]MDD5889211.1 cation:proton antiporter [Ruminococcus sp.]MDD6531997.1 cation:proton antiporter [Ruminococcus sp.]MDY3662927.1 cation:proton antiporter [Ruminococcus bovis]